MTNEAEQNAEVIQTNLAIVDEVSVALDKLADKYKDLPAIDIATPDGYAEAKQRKKPLTKLRTRCEDARKNAGRVLLDEKKRIDDTAKRIFAGIAEYEQPLIDGIKAADDAEKERIAEKGRIEQARVDAITDRLYAISMLKITAESVELIDAAMVTLDSENPDTADERKSEMIALISMIRETLTDRRARLVEQAEEAARLEQQRAEQAEQQRKLDEQQAAIDAENKRIADAKAAEERESETKRREAEAAEKAAAQAVEDERKRVEAEKAEAERVERERVAREQVEAAERERQAAMAPDREKLVDWFASVPALPDMATDECKVEAMKLQKKLAEIQMIIGALESAQQEKAA